jgi:phosphatidylglycerophosphate synthase
MSSRHLPNILSASRIPGALLLLALYRPDDVTRAELSIGLLLLIMATDVLDGRIARRSGNTSEFGYMLDGLGDRAVHVAAYLLLATAQIIPLPLAWALIFREVCQYGVRLVEPAWHATQSRTDRRVTRLYAVTVHVALMTEFGRAIIMPGPPGRLYTVAFCLVLSVAVIASYSRIFPRLVRAWREAAGG